MRLTILPDAEKPAYRQIFEQIAAQILSGELEGGAALPPIRTVSRELGVSVITVRGAWDALEAEGLIEARVGSGCYVAALPPEELAARRREALSEPLERLVSAAKELGFSEKETVELLSEYWK